MRWTLGLGLGLVGCTTPTSNAELASLQIVGAPLTPSFEPDQRAYVVRKPDLAPVAQIRWETSDRRAQVRVRQRTMNGEDMGRGANLPLLSSQRVTVEVQSSDGTATTSTDIVVLPHDFPTVEVRRLAEGDLAPGYWFLALLENQGEAGEYGKLSMIVDNDGVVRWFQRHPASAYDFKLHPSGRVGWIGFPGEGEGFQGMMLDDDWRARTPVLPVSFDDKVPFDTDVHEYTEFADGRQLIIGNWVETLDLTDIGGPDTLDVVHHEVQELTPTGEIGFQWTTKGAFDLATVELWAESSTLDDTFEYAHVNAVQVDPADGHWLVSLRLRNQVLKVARTDTMYRGAPVMAGEVVWRLGGPDSDFAWVGDARDGGLEGFQGQHHAQMLPGDRLLVFDNAVYRETVGAIQDATFNLIVSGDARYAVYALDHEAGTATLEESFALTGASGVRAGGSVQRLDNGHTVVGWGDLNRRETAPVATELDAQGLPLAELWLSEGVWSYRITKHEVELPDASLDAVR